MLHACLLNLRPSSWQLAKRYHPHRRLILARTTYRAIQHFAQKDGDSFHETLEQEGQKGTPPAVTTSDPIPPSTKADIAHGLRTRSKGRGLTESKTANTKGTLGHIAEVPSRDERIELEKASRSLDQNSLKLQEILHRFKKNEESQRLRLDASGYADLEGTVENFLTWKMALKSFQSEARNIKPNSITESRQVTWIEMCTTVEEVRALWPRVPEKMRHMQKQVAMSLLSVTLLYVPEKLHLVFEAAISSSITAPPWYVIEDVIELLATRLCDIGLEEIRKQAAYALADKVVHILRTQRLKGRVQFSQATIHSILADLPVSDIEAWYQELCTLECALEPWTELQFASRLAKSSPTKALSAPVLQRLHEAQLLDINSPQAASVATTLLTFSKKELHDLTEADVTPADLFRSLHTIGLIPNVITYTTIIRGLCLREDLGTALDVFEVMQQHGVQPNEWTYSTLLHGCRLREDWAAFAEIGVRACHANILDPVVWNEILYAVYICVKVQHSSRLGPTRTILYAMNTIYSRVFDAQAIRPFITGRLTEMGELAGKQAWFPPELERLRTEIPPIHIQQLIQPRTDTISIMLLGLIRMLPLPYDVVVFYAQYRHMLSQGHPIARIMVQERGTFIHDIVLRNLVKWPNTLRFALDIIKDMMSSSSPSTDAQVTNPTPQHPVGEEQSAEQVLPVEPMEVRQRVEAEQSSAEEQQPASDEGQATAQATAQSQPSDQHPPESQSHAVSHPMPSVHTWTILVHGFMKSNQPQDAEYIMKLMRANGVEPNVVTWNTLAAGYASQQMIPEAVNAMRRMEAAGFEADEWTMRAFSRIHDKEAAVKLMEATVEANKARKEAVDQQQHEEEADAPEARTFKSEKDTPKQTSHRGDAVESGSEGTDELHKIYEVHQQQEEAYLDKVVEESIDNPGMSLASLAPEIMPIDVSRAIWNRMVARLEASGIPVTERTRTDIDAWLQMKDRGLGGMPKVPPRRVQDSPPSQAELRARLGRWTMFTEAELDARGVRVRPTPLPRENILARAPSSRQARTKLPEDVRKRSGGSEPRSSWVEPAHLKQKRPNILLEPLPPAQPKPKRPETMPGPLPPAQPKQKRRETLPERAAATRGSNRQPQEVNSKAKRPPAPPKQKQPETLAERAAAVRSSDRQPRKVDLAAEGPPAQPTQERPETLPERPAAVRSSNRQPGKIDVEAERKVRIRGQETSSFRKI